MRARIHHPGYRRTCDVVHGHQQLSLFNAHYDERCFVPIHVYDTESRPVAVVLRPGKMPGDVEVRPIFDAWYGTSARDGTRRELRSVVTDTMLGRRR